MAQFCGLGDQQCSASLPSEPSNIPAKTTPSMSRRSLLFVSNLASHPLFSILTTSCVLILLYVPRPLLPLVLSPVPISSLLLLSSLLRLGSSPDANNQQILLSDDPKPESEAKTLPELAPSLQNPNLLDSGVGWARLGGPLEVIYEEYEGEDDGDSPEYSPLPEHSETRGIGFGSLALCLGDSDSDSDSELASETQESLYFRWGEDEEEMIEIALEEDNLIEIDISGARRHF